MHTILAQVLAMSALRQEARLVFALVYARTNGSGRVEIPESDVLDALGGITSATLRRYRSELADAGVCAFTLREGVLVCEVAAHGVRAARMGCAADDENAHGVRGNPESADEENAHGVRAARMGCAAEEDRAHGVRGEEAQTPGENAHGVRAARMGCAADAPPHTPPMSVCLLINQETNKQTNTEGGVGETAERAPDARCSTAVDLADGEPVGQAEMQRTYRLLTDDQVGVGESTARELAGQHRFWWTLANVLTWRRQLLAGKVRNVGALVQRLHFGWTPEPIPAGDMETPLYQRHVTAAEQAALAASAAQAALESEGELLRLRYGAADASEDLIAYTRRDPLQDWRWHGLRGHMLELYPGFRQMFDAAEVDISDAARLVVRLPQDAQFGVRERKIAQRIAQSKHFEVVFDAAH